MSTYEKECEELAVMFASSRIRKVEVSDRGTVSISLDEIKRSPIYKEYFGDSKQSAK